jgi:hypothetical protein
MANQCAELKLRALDLDEQALAMERDDEGHSY